MRKITKKYKTPAKLLQIEHKKNLVAWSRTIKERDGYKCIVCGNTQKLNSHHILSKFSFKEYSLCLDNGICLCAGRCHMFGRYSAHQNSIFFAEWLRNNRPELYKIAIGRLKNG
jgi:hypothetical protein